MYLLLSEYGWNTTPVPCELAFDSLFSLRVDGADYFLLVSKISGAPSDGRCCSGSFTRGFFAVGCFLSFIKMRMCRKLRWRGSSDSARL